MEAHDQAHNQPQSHLTEDLELALQAMLVVLEHLNIIVQKAHRAQPDRRQYHQQYIDVVQPAQQQHRNQNGSYDNQPSHRRRTLLFLLACQTQIANRLPDLLAGQYPDNPFAYHHRNEQGHHNSCRCPKRDVLEHPCPRNSAFMQIVKQIVQHCLALYYPFISSIIARLHLFCQDILLFRNSANQNILYRCLQAPVTNI